MYTAPSLLLERPSQRPARLKLVTVGDQGAGKTTLLLKGLAKEPVSHEEAHLVKPTVGLDFCVKHHEASDGSGETAIVECWDLSGQERFYALSQDYIRRASAVVIVYDTTISAEEARQSVQRWHGVVSSTRHDALLLPVIVVGNKTDLNESFRSQHTLCVNWCEDNNLSHFFTSALVGDTASVGVPLHCAIEAAMARNREQRANDSRARGEMAIKLERGPTTKLPGWCCCGT